MTSFSLLKEFSANKLKELRERHNLTQEELAEELTKRKLKREEELYKNKKNDKIDHTPITRQTVSKYENATIGMNQDILFDVASIFGKSINDFFPPLSFENSKDELPLDELDLLWSKYKDDLTEDGKEMIKFMLLKKKKEIDEQESNN